MRVGRLTPLADEALEARVLLDLACLAALEQGADGPFTGRPLNLTNTLEPVIPALGEASFASDQLARNRQGIDSTFSLRLIVESIP